MLGAGGELVSVVFPLVQLLMSMSGAQERVELEPYPMHDRDAGGV